MSRGYATEQRDCTSLRSQVGKYGAGICADGARAQYARQNFGERVKGMCEAGSRHARISMIIITIE